MKHVILIFTCLALFSCNRDNEQCVTVPDTSSQQIQVEITQLEDSIASFSSKQDFVDFLSNQYVVRDYFFHRTRDYPNDSIFINTLYQRFTHPAFDTLLMETKRVFGDLTPLRLQLNEAFTNLHYYYPDFKTPSVKTTISGIESDLFVSDSLIIIGLDYYLGKGSPYRPKLYDYLLTRYDPEDIVPSIMLMFGISNVFNNTDLQDQTVLADMIAYGKAFYFAKHMLPCIPDSIFIGYTDEDMKGATKNEKLIWYRFVEDEVLFSTNHIMKQKFLSERPKTLEVGEKCPGRIGQWVGWQIVKKYMETHPQTTLPQLMQMSDAQKIFRESKYKP